MDDGGKLSRRTLLTGAAGAAVLLGGGGALAKHEIDKHPGLRHALGLCGDTPAIPHDEQHSIVTFTIESKAMRRAMPVTVAMPLAPHDDLINRRPSPPVPLVLALPGEGGSETSVTGHLGLQAFATSIGFTACFVSPGDVQSSYYHPRRDGTDMLKFLADEVLPRIETRRGTRVGGSRAMRAVYGYSMGGYGALLLAQQRADLFGAAAAASPAVFPTYHDAVTGHPGTFDSQEDWERYGVWQNLSAMGDVPVRIDCGDADPFAPTARRLLARIPKAEGEISSGCHDVGFWRRAAPGGLAFLKSRLSSG